jgi:uncharacterized protein
MHTALKPIAITDLLRMPDNTLRLEVSDRFPELETLTPIAAKLSIRHQGTYLEVTAQADTIISLTCDRCLGQYRHPLQVDTREFIWLQMEGESLPQDLSEDWAESSDLIESIPAQGRFDCAQWLYEQLCLALPIQQLCDEVCVPEPTEHNPPAGAIDSVDHRWAALAKLQEQLSNS